LARIQITWVKSGIGYNRDQRKTLKSLGFKRLNQKVTQKDSASLRGMINKVRHLVHVEEAADEAG
jgi:large subunit ribosomal protein L30